MKPRMTVLEQTSLDYYYTPDFHCVVAPLGGGAYDVKNLNDGSHVKVDNLGDLETLGLFIATLAMYLQKKGV